MRQRTRRRFKNERGLRMRTEEEVEVDSRD